jgi:uncharacterized protein (DUF427 family)
MKTIRLTHRPSGTLLAEGPRGFKGIMPFEGNFYVRRRYLRTDRLKVNGVPGLCPYKFLYVWMDLRLDGEDPVKYFGWLYWLPNPLLPFIWWRVALPGNHPEVRVEELDSPNVP